MIYANRKRDVEIYLLFIYSFVSCVHVGLGNIANFEIESAVGGPESPRATWRSNASNGSSLHLYDGDRIEIDICLPEAMTISVGELVYSNDGMSDAISVSLDNVGEKSLTEESLNGWGRNWDVFKVLPLSNRGFQFQSGQYKLDIDVIKADCYGVEFDYISVVTGLTVNADSVFCGSRYVHSANPPDCSPDPPAKPATTLAQTTGQQTFSTPGLPRVTPTTTPASTSEIPGVRTTPRSTVQQTSMRTSASPSIVTASTTTTAPPITTRTPSTTATTTSTKSPTTSTPTTTTPITTTPITTTTTTTTPITTAPTTTTPITTTPITTKSTTTTSTTTTLITTTPITKTSTTTTPTTTTPITTTPTNSKPTTTRTTSTASTVVTTKAPSTIRTTSTPVTVASTTGTTSSTEGQTSRAPLKTTKKPAQFMKQLSSPNVCLTKKNIRLQFNPTTLKGVKVFARHYNPRNIEYLRKEAGASTKNCEDLIWQIGEFNFDNVELGPLRYTSIDHDVGANDVSQMPFPGLINPKFTTDITIRYTVPNDVNLRRGDVYLSVGLVNVTASTTIGMKFHVRRKKDPSEVEYVTLTPENSMAGWDIPARAISPSLENIITLYFNQSSTPIKVDFLKLEYTGNQPKVSRQKVFRSKSWRVNAYNFKRRKRGPKPKGMKVTVDGKAESDNAHKVVFFYRPLRKSLTVFQNGKLFPLNEMKSREENEEGSMLSDVSGFTFGNPNNEIRSIDYTSAKELVRIGFEDDAVLQFTLNYTDFRTKLSVIHSTVSPSTVEFFSTYITDYITAVNEVIIDNKHRFDIMDNDLEKTKNIQYTFLQTTPNEMFKVNDEYELVFPRKILPK